MLLSSVLGLGLGHASGHPQLIFVKKDEESLREIVEILKPFAEATTLLQGSLYATIGCVIPCVISLYRHVSDFQKNSETSCNCG